MLRAVPRASRQRLLGVALILSLLVQFVVAVPVAWADNFTVSNTNDSGDGSLRKAITDANANPGADTITFDPGVSGTITLESALPAITGEVTITGPGADVLAVSGANAFRVFAVASGADVAISGLTVTQGWSSWGAGISNEGTLAITNVTIRDSYSSTFGGGILSNGMLTVNSSTISGNSASNAGGISNGINGTLNVTNSTIDGNSAAVNGGGIYSDGTLNVTNSTISGNSAGNGGGVINGGTLTVTSSTISGNSADNGGGINTVPGSALTLNGSIVAGNTANPGPDVSGAVVATSSDNLIGNGTDMTGITNGIDFNQIGTAVSPIDPLLGPLQDNGGPTLTQALLVGSPAIDTGGAICLATDQRGAPRPRGLACDIGAFESSIRVVTNNNDDGAGSLRAAITAANAESGPDTIVFDFDFGDNDTITLASALPVLVDQLAVEGPGADVLAVSGANTFRVFAVASGADVTISGLTITYGSADAGGGIRNDGTLTVNSSTITGNSVPEGYYGGGIHNSNEGTLTVKSSTISGNSADTGGGIDNDGTLAVNSSTISGNSARFWGGGISNAGMLTISSSTISGNSVTNGTGGGIYTDGMLTLASTIVAGNSAPNGPDVSSTDFASGSHNLIGTGDNLPGISNGSNGNQVGTANNLIDPLLGPLQDNGGLTLTHALLAGSPAIDTGGAACPDTDQRGIARPQGAACDIGAFELRPLPDITLTLTPPAPDGDNDWYASDIDVTWTIGGEDAEIDSGCQDQTIDVDTAGLVLTCIVDGPDGTTTFEPVTIKRDATAPLVTAPDDVIVVAPSQDPVAITYPDAMTSDAPSGVADGWPQCVPASGSLFPLGATLVTCTATDNAGNEGSDTFTITVVRDWVQGCLYAGSLTQVSPLAYGASKTVSCTRGVPVTLEQGSSYYGCVFAGSLSQAGTTAPASCGRGAPISLAAGEDLWGCLYAGSLTRVGTDQPSNCGRGTLVGFKVVE